MSGYCHPIVFKDITDDQIATVEKFMREQAPNHLVSESNALLGNEYLIQIFGKRYANCAEQFEFLPGEKDYIKKIVAHVKKLVDDGTGMKLFKERNKNFKKFDVFSSSSAADPTLSMHNQNQSELFKQLFVSVSNCLISYNVDISAWSEKFVEVDPSGSYGNIYCILCYDSDSNLCQKLKRVSYFSSGKRSSFWALSNFKKHLEKVHLLKAIQSKPEKKMSVKNKSIGKSKKKTN